MSKGTRSSKSANPSDRQSLMTRAASQFSFQSVLGAVSRRLTHVTASVLLSSRSLSSLPTSSLLTGSLCLLLSACSKAPGPDALVVTQVPPQKDAQHATVLDARYPPGSRIVLVQAPYSGRQPRVLSEGLCAAGGPVLAYSGRSVVFCGKAKASDDWQIYQSSLTTGHARRLTTIPGGAMQPAFLPDGRLVFASPVPRVGQTNDATPPTLYTQRPTEAPCRLTFGPGSSSDPIVLADGRIAFVYSPPANLGPPAGLYTINNDGTEIDALGCQHDPRGTIAHPRALPDGRLVFLTGRSQNGCGTPESIRLARPFVSRALLLTNFAGAVSSVEPAADGALLVCADTARTPAAGGPAPRLYRLELASLELGSPVLGDSQWGIIEAVQASAAPRPMGRLSNMQQEKSTGQLLCLNANDSVYGSAGGRRIVEPATRIRVLAERTPGVSRVLGEVAVQPDGSFMAEVPADLPLGFEALDAQGRVLRRVDPMIWVRPGENRSCLGCHPAHNHAPHNHRPLAVREPVPRLGPEPTGIARTP